MKKFLLIFILFPLFTEIKSQVKEELRATWLTNVDSNVLFTDQAITEAVDFLAANGFNVIFPVVYNKGYTLYPSEIMKKLFGTSVLPNSPFLNRDFLERLIIEAHRVGIEVIPWFEFGFSTSYSLNGGHIISKFPSWALKDNNGKLVVKNGFDWMSAINPDAQNFILSLILEVIDKYDVDGIQGDDRLPAMPVEGGYDSITVSIYKLENNGNNPPTDPYNSNWMRWRANKLNDFQQRLKDSIKVRNKNLIVSSSPTPYYWGYSEYLQDSKSWAIQKLVDNIIPQLYQYNISDYNYALNKTWNDLGSQSSNIFNSGILLRIGNYIADTTFLSNMIQANRTKGIKGESFFYYEGLRANNNRVANFLKKNFYYEPAILPYRNGLIWRPKGIIQNETSSDVIKKGEWENYTMKGYEGAIIRTSSTNKNSSIEYYIEIVNSAYYDVYDYRVPNLIWTKNANYTLYTKEGQINKIIDQSDVNKKGWQKLGTVYLSRGRHKVVTIDNSKIEQDRYLVADAVMLIMNRKLSPEVVVKVEEERKEEIPTEIKLYQNYPNPFNPITTIRYTISADNLRQAEDKDKENDMVRMSNQDVTLREVQREDNIVTLKIYDILGREVTTLVNERQTAGNYEVKFDGSKLSSGVYFYILKYYNFVQAKKMILIK